MVDWQSWRKHVDYVIETRGKWYGLGDGDGAPLFDLPDPVSAGSPEQWMNAADLEFTFPAVNPDGRLGAAARLLIMDDLGNFDPSGQLPTAAGEYTLLVAMRGVDGGVVRRGGMITHASAQDPSNVGIPTEVTINALSFMDVWSTVPAVSWPAAWWRATPYPRTSDEAAIEYEQAWDMASVELATRTTFTWKNGPAGFVIRRLAQESLDAVMMTQRDPGGTRWVDDPFHVVEVPEVDTTPEISLDSRDGSLWDTVAGQAKNAGVILGARLWWPGDRPVRSWSLARSTMQPVEVDISPSVGESRRRVVEQVFEHPMVVLTVKEVG